MQDNQCRICGVVPSGETISIFKGSGIYKDIAEKISSCLPITVNKDDLFPKIICSSCGTQINKFFDLQEKSKETEHFFKNSLITESVFEASHLNIKKEPLSPLCSPNQSPLHHTEDKNPIQEHQEFVFCEPLMSINEETHLVFESEGSSHRNSCKTNSGLVSSLGILNQIIEYDPMNTNKISLDKSISNAGSGTKVIYECAYCNLYFNTFDMSETHIKEIHHSERQERMKLKCLARSTTSAVDSPQFNSNSTARQTTTTTMFRCTYCKLMFSTRDASASHILEAHKKEREERFALSEIKQNMKPSLGNPSKSTEDTTNPNRGSKQNITLFRCKFCNLMFKSHEATQAHINEKHKININYKCEYCNTNFETQQELLVHNQSVCLAMLKKCKKNIQCDYCGKKHFSVKDVKHHILQCHLCMECGKIYKEESFENMVCHKKDHVIASLKSEKCNICGASFMHSSNLIVHMQCHLKEQPFECHLCPCKYYSWQGLNKHLLTHPGMIIYACDFCNKAFAQADYLKLHKRSHTSDKPFLCDVCDKCFTELNALNKHRLIHDKNYLKCDKCGEVVKSRSALSKHLKSHV